MRVESLAGWASFWYVATPYSKYPHGRTAAYLAACRVGGDLMSRGVRCFVPIAHSHGIELHGGTDSDHDFWMGQDAPFMWAAVGLIVVKLPGWLQSRGVKEEIDTFTEAGKPVFYLSPESLHLSEQP